MYQTLQQSLKKLQQLVQNWPESELNDGPLAPQLNLGGHEEPHVERDRQDKARQDKARPASDLLNQFKSLKQVWMEQSISIQSHTTPQYWQALQTEMNKQFRLAEADFLFLKTARQPRTIIQRRQQLCDRLDQLISYCETGIKLSQQIAPQGDEDMLACPEQSD